MCVFKLNNCLMSECLVDLIVVLCVEGLSMGVGGGGGGSKCVFR